MPQPGFLPRKALEQVIDLCKVLLGDPVLDSSGDILHLQYLVLLWSVIERTAAEIWKRQSLWKARGTGWKMVGQMLPCCPMGSLLMTSMILEMDI